MLTHHENRQSIMQRCSARIFLKVISLILLVLQECSSEAVIKLHCHFKYCICVIPCLRSKFFSFPSVVAERISILLEWSVPSPPLCCTSFNRKNFAFNKLIPPYENNKADS